jgi:cytochrome c oxidase subunit 2
VLVASPELHLPVDQPVKVLLRSKDVLHNFTVTQFRVKMDLVPGMITHLWLTPTVPGSYEILCEELCGVGHFAMRGRVVVTKRDEFDTWLAAMPTYSQTQALAKADPGRGRRPVRRVHAPAMAPSGEGNPGAQRAADRGQAAWYIGRQLHHFRDGLRGAHEGDTYGAQMRAFASMLPDDVAIRNIAAYIESLPGSAHPGQRGRQRGSRPAPVHDLRRLPRPRGPGHLGAQCAAAQRHVGLVSCTAAREFPARGPRTHRQDYYGWQMATMADSLKDERSINDVVAYINTLDPRTN